MRLLDCFDCVYVINLDSRPDRMMNFRESMRSLGLLDHEIDEKIIRFPGVIPPSGAGPLGCTLSHLEIVRDAKRRGYEKILVFEDDAEPFAESLSYFNDVADDINSQDWDVYYLGYNSHTRLGLHSKNSLVARELFSTHAIAYRSSFFDRFINDHRHDKIKIFDVWISEEVQTSMRCLASYPMLFIQRESYSDIEKKNVNYGIQIERYQNYTSHLPKPFKKED
jgi:hypothetical protein